MSRSDRIEIYEDTKGGWRFRLVAANGEIIATGESYTRRWSAKRAARRTFPGHPITYV